MKFLITGDSHTAALSKAWYGGLQESTRTDLEVSVGALGNGWHLQFPFFSVDSKGIRFTGEGYDAGFRSSGRTHMVAESGILYGLSMGLHTGVVVGNATWKTHAPWRVAKGTMLHPVSDDVIFASARNYSRYVLNLFDEMISLKIPFLVIEAPPIRQETHCAEPQALPEEVVIEVDRLFRKAIVKDLEHRNIGVVRYPKKSVDADGFLRREYAIGGNDPHHTNGTYGALVMRDAIEAAERLSHSLLRAVGS
jgi:hypothetical protein